MAFKMILAVNFTPERFKQLKLLGLLTKAQVKAVTEEEKDDTVGKVLGLTEEVNLLLDAIRRGRLKNIPLKAMVTPTNISWTINTILQELNKEHEYFKNMKKKGK